VQNRTENNINNNIVILCHCCIRFAMWIRI